MNAGDRATLNSALDSLFLTPEWRRVIIHVLSLASGDSTRRASVVVEAVREKLLSAESPGNLARQRTHLRS